MAGLLTDAQKTWMQTIVTSSLDVTVTVQRLTPAQDGYGHDNGTYSTVGAAQCNIIKPSATTLQAYAGIIGSQRALLLRYMPTSDIREGDQILYQSVSWKVHGIQSAESYTFTDEVLITTIA